jgi:hypothetical protein
MPKASAGEANNPRIPPTGQGFFFVDKKHLRNICLDFGSNGCYMGKEIRNTKWQKISIL